MQFKIGFLFLSPKVKKCGNVLINSMSVQFQVNYRQLTLISSLHYFFIIWVPGLYKNI